MTVPADPAVACAGAVSGTAPLFGSEVPGLGLAVGKQKQGSPGTALEREAGIPGSRTRGHQLRARTELIPQDHGAGQPPGPGMAQPPQDGIAAPGPTQRGFLGFGKGSQLGKKKIKILEQKLKPPPAVSKGGWL